MERNYSDDELAALREGVGKNTSGLFHCSLIDWKLGDGYADLELECFNPVYFARRVLVFTDSGTLPIRFEKDGEYLRVTEVDRLYPDAECYVPFTNARITVDEEGYLMVTVDIGSSSMTLTFGEFEDMIV